VTLRRNDGLLPIYRSVLKEDRFDIARGGFADLIVIFLDPRLRMLVPDLAQVAEEVPIGVEFA